MDKMKNNILNILNEKKISIRQLSKDLELSYSHTHGLVNREDLNTIQAGTLLNIANYLDVDITKLYKGEKKMIREKYEIRYNELAEEKEYKYFIVGSPTNLRIVKEVKGDSLKEIWERLLDMNEIDVERYDLDHEVFDEEKEVYNINEPSNYKLAIEEYLKDSNNFYYKKYNW